MGNKNAKAKIKIISCFKLLAVVFSLSLLVFNFHKVHADSCSDQCANAYPNDPDQQNKCEDNCKDLEKKAKVYQDIIDLKNKQQDTLANLLDTINKEQERNQINLKTTQEKVMALSSQISSLEREIKEKEKSIASQKIILESLMQSYYEYDQQGILEMVLLDKNLSNLNQTDYLEQSGIRTTDILSDIKKTRDELANVRDELAQKKDKLQKTQDELKQKKSELQNSENQKANLLKQTQGEEQKYQALLARVEEQKRELFNFSEASNLDEVRASVSSYSKPKSNLASTGWYFSQADSRWGNKKIGNSSSLMKNYGCAVTSVSMVFRKLGASVDPGQMAKQKMFYYDLIKWPGSWSPGIELVSSISHGNVSWSKINSEIKKGHPVIVYIKKTNGRGGHYVVITGKDSKDYIVHDPYFGPNLYLGTSRSLVGKIGANSKTVIDQMIIYN